MVYSTYLWRFWGWFIIVLPTLQMDHWFTVFTLVGYAGYGGCGGWRFKQQQWGCKQEPLETSQKMGT